MALEHKTPHPEPGDLKLNGIYLGPRNGDGITYYNMLVDLTNAMELPSFSQVIRYLIEQEYNRRIAQQGELYPAIEDLIEYVSTEPTGPEYEAYTEREEAARIERQRALDQAVNDTEL